MQIIIKTVYIELQKRHDLSFIDILIISEIEADIRDHHQQK